MIAKLKDWSLKKPLWLTRAGLATALLMASASAPLHATDWYLHADQPGSDNWTFAADWWSTLEGAGTHPVSVSATDNFFGNGFAIRSPGTSNVETFAGNSLTLNGSSLLIKSLSTTNATTIGNFISYGGSVVNASGNVQIVHITNFNNFGSNTTLDTGGATRGLNVTIGTLVGSGDLTLTGAGTILLTVNAASEYYGIIYAAGATNITFQNAFTSRGGLIVPSGVPVTLNAAITVSSLVVADVPKAAGAYSAAALGFSGTGSIVVSAPVSWHLHASMGLADSWNTLGDWWSAPTGGINPAAISSNDDFYTNHFQLRTTSGSANAPFGGASLTLNGGSLLLKNLGAYVASIPYVAAGGGSIVNGTGGNLNLAIREFNAAATTTFDTSAANRGFNLSMTTLSGNGAINLLGHGGGPLLVNIANANNYTGAISLSPSSTGALTFQNSLFSAGSLVVGAGNSVVVNQPVSFSGVTVGGVAKAAGTYTAASLGFTGAGTVTVSNRPPKMYGVNWSGMEGQTTIVPADASFAYYQTKGLTLIRVPFKWERIQPVLNGPLDPTQLGYLDTVLTRAANHGIKIILDMHNYGKYGSNQIGTTQVPYAAYQDVWSKLGAHFAASPNAGTIYAYDIMNEPNAASLDWPTAAQYGINGVRTGDASRFIMVEGKAYSSAKDWPKVNAGLADIVDPQKKIIFSAHCYFAKANNDQYLTYDAEGAYPNKGVDLVSPFVEWCKQHKVHGHIGEYGVPYTDIRWNAVLENFLQYLSDNDISGTYWSGGAVSVNYPLRCEPTSNNTVDEPQMAVLQLFHQ